MKPLSNQFKKKTKKKKRKKINIFGKVEEKKRLKNIILSLIVICFFGVLSLLTYYYINMSKVSNDNSIKEVTINEGSITSVAETLKENNLIRNITVFKIYVKLSGNTNLKAGNYELSENMGTKKIIQILHKGSKRNPNEVSITFKEGINIREFANIISDMTNNSYDSIIELVTNSEYIDSLINEYWFLTDDIKNKNIYYPLEGYLHPNTYVFMNNEVNIKDIIKKILDETNNKLSNYKEDIQNSEYSIHEIITLASIVELEVANANDRKDVAEVFINRLNSNYYPTLGSDASSYYGAKVDDWKNNPLTYKELNDCNNKYNTRCPSNTGIPVGPICNPSIEAIEAVLYPSQHNYYYFVNDCEGKLYLSKNESEHNNIISKLKRENNWCA